MTYVSTVFELVLPVGDSEVPTEVVPLPDRFLVRVPHGAENVATKLQKVAIALAETADASISLVLNKAEPYKNPTYRTLAEAVSLLYNEWKDLSDDDEDEDKEEGDDDEEDEDFDDDTRARVKRPRVEKTAVHKAYELPTATQLTIDLVQPHLNRTRPDGDATFRPPPLRLGRNERFVVVHCVLEQEEEDEEEDDD